MPIDKARALGRNGRGLSSYHEITLILLLTRIQLPKECHDLCPHAGVVRAKETVPDPVGDTVIGSPLHSLCIVGINRHIREGGCAVRRRSDRAEEESYTLRSRAGRVGAELAPTDASGDPIFNRPSDCLCVVAACRDIGETAYGLRLGGSGRTPQEGDDLGASAGRVRAE